MIFGGIFMSYFLKKTTPSSKGTYLQIYENNYIPGVGKRNKSYKSIGYVSELIKAGIENPIEHFQKEVDKLNEELKQSKEKQISNVLPFKNLGYFLVKAMLDKLSFDTYINVLASNYKAHYKFSDMVRALIYSQILMPGSKLKAFEKVIPNIYGSEAFSYDQILNAVEFIGSDYHKFVEILNLLISNNYERNTNKVYFDCTNYYFEIDQENDFLRKGPSKENRKCPLLSQALMLDADQIPIDTQFFPGNQSEIPQLRKRVEDMKSRNNVSGRIIQVADKGLNCARNIYSAVIEAKDGYIFSKSIKGTNLTKTQKEWILLSDDKLNQWVEVRNPDGSLHYKYKTVKTIGKNNKIYDFGVYTYKCKINPEDTFETEFTVKEKRIVTYNPKLASKQRREILKDVEKAKNTISYKQAIHDELGSSSKYVNFEAKDVDGRKIKIATSINQEKIDEDLKYCGYNMLITSELKADPLEIYKIYHNLWRIEESFRVMKTYLEARPVFLSNENSIYGHFTICYFGLTLMRLLELKIFKDDIPISKLFEFIRQYNVVMVDPNTYINCSSPSETYLKIKEKLGLLKLGNAKLTNKDIELLLKTELD